MLKDIVRNGYSMGRRSFFKAAGIGVSMLIISQRASHKAYAEVKDYVTSRIAAVYSHDEHMSRRKSQDNPMVKKLYSDFLPYPYCEKSHHLLHSFYVDRSKALTRIPNWRERLK